MVNITDAMLKKDKLETGRYTDASNKGLSLVVSQKRRTWVVRYTDKAGTRTEERLGEYIPNLRPTHKDWPLHLGLADARVMANERIRDSRLGVPKKSAGEGWTLEQDTEEWIALVKNGFKRPEKAATHRRGMLARHVPQLLAMRTTEITEDDILAALRRIVDETAKETRGLRQKPTDLISTAKDVRYYLREVFHRAIRTGPHRDRWPIKSNPVDGLMREKFGKHRKVHRKSMKYEDLPRFYAELMRANSGELNGWFYSLAATAIRLVLLTLSPRVNEVVSMQWQQLRLDQPQPEWWIPNDNMKVDKDRDDDVMKRPLSPQAVSLLRDIKPANAKPTDYVFPRYARSKDGRPRFLDYTIPMQTMSPILWMRRNGYVDETVHGLRTSLLNRTAEKHQHLILAAEAALDHNLLKGMAGKDYITTKLPRDMRKLAELIGDFLEPKRAIKLPPITRGRKRKDGDMDAFSRAA